MTIKTRLFAPITKTADRPDGALEVWGYASSEVVDSDGETVTAEAMRKALPGYLEWGAVREMHKTQAAGKALSAQVLDDGRTEFAALVVDPVAVEKVRQGVYKGFSIGGSVITRDPAMQKRVTEIDLTEISLVDRPANPEARITLVKRDRLDKSLWDVARVADLLNDLQWAKDSLASDAAWEGDASPIPARIGALVSELAQILRELVAEETSELIATPTPTPVATEDAAAKSAKADPLQKMAEPTTPPTPVALLPEVLAKLDKLGSLEKGVGDLLTLTEGLMKRIDTLERQPAPANAILKMVGEPDDASLTPEQRAFWEIKKLQPASPIQG